MLIYILIIIGLIVINYFLSLLINNYYENKKIKRWRNASHIEKEIYKKQYGCSPPGW